VTGSIFKINALGHQIVFVGSAALAEELCDETRFRKCVTGPVVEIRAAVHDSLFTAYHDEPSWGVAHRIMAPLVTPDAADAMFNQMRDSLSAIVAKWTASPNQRVDVTADLKRQSLQSVTACFFNQKANHLEGPMPPMISAMDNSTLEAMKRPARPKLLTKFLYQKKFDKDIKTMRGFGADIIAARKAEETTETSKADLLHALLHAKDPETGESLDQDKIIDEIINIYIGAATCPCFISFTLYYLTKNPDVITKAREEIDSVLGADGELTSSDLAKLPYCEAVLREAMRLSAVAPGFNIEPIPSDTKADIELADGKYKIPHNQAMIIILAAVNRDPEVFTDLEVFRPERMLGEAYDNLPAGVKKGFGNGKRECYGKQYAWRWSFATLVTILRSVDVAEADKSYELKQNGAFCVEPLQFFAKTGPRKADGGDEA
jgi:cytochrome P450